MPTTTTRPASPRRSPFVALAAVAIGSMSLLGIHLQAEPAAEDARPVEASPDASYALGYVIAHRLAEAGIDVDTAALREGFRDAHQAEAPRLTVDEMRSALATIVPAGDAAPATPPPPGPPAPPPTPAPPPP
ncbi:MAG: FKBP-type peptidyl-prolyl cis-trans isomerase N-terminal domain-containing protein, partial [Planctomycetota bacterium]